MRAYTEVPLPDPPKEYVDRCHGVDWEGSYTRNHYAIVLAGSQRECDFVLLKRLLNNAPECMRDGPILAASSFSDAEFMSTLASIAMSVEEVTAQMTGEMWALRTSFDRWIRRDQLTHDGLLELLSRNENADERFLRAKRFMNYLRCPFWRDLPFPEEAPPR
jgi:hypothetical protein